MRRIAELPRLPAFRVLLVVFAKAPVPGRVKTRLQPLLGPGGAARLHARLVLRALATARAASCGDVELCCAPHRRHAFFQACARRYRVPLTAQGGGDIGARMFRAIARGLRNYDGVLLMGSDCPCLRPSSLRAAARALRGGADAVFAPAEDGGYGLIGATRVSQRMFAAVPWGTDAVMARTRRNLRRLGRHWHELPAVWDVDRPQDHARLLRSRLLERAT